MSWQELVLGDLYDISSSKRVLKSDWKSSGIPFYRGREVSSLSKHGFVQNELYIAQEMYELYAKKYGVPQAEDIVITAIGTIGNAYIVKKTDRFYFKDASVLWLKKVKPINPYFVKYWIESEYFKNQLDVGNGATVDTLSIGKLNSLKINVPSLAIQQKIVEKLDAIFAEIDKATAAAEANIKNAEALFQSYLTQVFERGGDDWLRKSIGEVCVLRSGATVNSRLERFEGEIPYLKVADMNLEINQESVVSSTRFLNFSDINKNSIIPTGATIFPKRGGAIDTNKKRLLAVDVAIDLNIMSVFPREILNPLLLFFFFLKTDMKKLGSGATIRQINNYDIEPLTISFPKEINEQVKLVNKLGVLKNQTENLIAYYKDRRKNYSSFRKSILLRAFSDELVKE